jgi:hypothetical protein
MENHLSRGFLLVLLIVVTVVMCGRDRHEAWENARDKSGDGERARMGE